MNARRDLRLVPVAFVGALLVLALVTVVFAAGLSHAQSPGLQGGRLAATSPGTAFTYQGYLTDGLGDPVDSSCDFRLRLYDAPSGGTQMGSDQILAGVSVDNGYFALAVDTGPGAFNGNARWLEVAVRATGDPDYTAMPRQSVSPVPYALALPGLQTRQHPSPDEVMASPNVIGGYSANVVLQDVWGATIAGGGFRGQFHTPLGEGANEVVDDFGTVGGGGANQAGSNNSSVDSRYATVGGGWGNYAGAFGATVSGGARTDTLEPATGNRVTDEYGTVGGGGNNQAGNANEATDDSPYATVGGGRRNTSRGEYATIGGGYTNTVASSYGSVGGGRDNLADGYACTISGGHDNAAYNEDSTVCGGSSNTALGNRSTVGGGRGNEASGAYATVAGGRNGAATYPYAAIGGGYGNEASGDYATVAGGTSNTAGGIGGTVSGGSDNSASGNRATVAGGWFNTAAGSIGTVSGGGYNSASVEYATVSGGSDNQATGPYATVAGGVDNTASGNNSTVGGGHANSATGAEATVPGGGGNLAQGDFSFAGGRQAKALHQGSFVWGDATAADFSSSGSNQFLIRAGGGVGIATDAPATQLHVTKSADGNAGDLVSNVAVLENTSATAVMGPDVLALKITNVSDPAAKCNFVTFFDSDGSLAAIQGNGAGGVTYMTTGGDFAEYLPQRDVDELLAPGDVVGVHQGRVARATADSDQVLVVATSPAFVGNAPPDHSLAEQALVSLLGQVLVRVQGPVRAGDYIVPSGLEDGTGVAISPERLDTWHLGMVVGRACATIDTEEVSLVTILVGLPQGRLTRTVLQAQARRIESLEQRLASLETLLAQRQEGGEP